VADDTLLFFYRFALTFDFFHSPLTFLQWYRYVNFQVDPDLAIKKPAKKSLRVLAGINDKPKKLYATCLGLLYVNSHLKARNYARSIQFALECGDEGHLLNKIFSNGMEVGPGSSRCEQSFIVGEVLVSITPGDRPRFAVSVLRTPRPSSLSPIYREGTSKHSSGIPGTYHQTPEGASFLPEKSQQQNRR